MASAVIAGWPSMRATSISSAICARRRGQAAARAARAWSRRKRMSSRSSISHTPLGVSTALIALAAASTASAGRSGVGCSVVIIGPQRCDRAIAASDVLREDQRVVSRLDSRTLLGCNLVGDLVSQPALLLFYVFEQPPGITDGIKPPCGTPLGAFLDLP